MRFFKLIDVFQRFTLTLGQRLNLKTPATIMSLVLLSQKKPEKIADKWNLFGPVISIRKRLTGLRLPTL